MQGFFAKLFGSVLGTILWVFTGGAMMLHISAFFFVAEQGLLLTIVGAFIPPIGIVNAISLVVSGTPITEHF